VAPTILDPTLFVPVQPSPLWQPNVDSLPIQISTRAGTQLHIVSEIPRPLPRTPRPFVHHDFHSFATTSPAWEFSLLAHVKFFLSPIDLMEMMANPEPGSSTIVRLGAPHYGPGYGVGTSHRAEGWGKLSGVCFLQRLAEYTRTPYSPSLQLQTYSDNKGLITRLTSRQQYTVVYANATLDADWDITEQIHSTVEHLHIQSHSYEWVKGHQDDHIRYNVRADELAKEYMLEYQPPELTESPLLPACRCNFQLGPITHQGHFIHCMPTSASITSGLLRPRQKWIGPSSKKPPITTPPPTIIC
jgi:hypothetical protein